MTKRHAVRSAAASASKGALVMLCVAALTAGSAFSQSGKPPDEPGKDQPRNQPRLDNGKPAPKSEPKVDPKAEAAPAEPGADGKTSAKLRSSLANKPQTADEKAKMLSDLYAQLSTADDEASAKKFAGQIERLWSHSGSDTIDLLIERSNAALKKNKPELAQTLLDRAVSLAPDYAEAFNQRAYFHYVRNNYDAAVGDLRRVLALDPNHYKALEGLAQIWRDTGNKKGAYGVMKQLMDVHPHAPGAKAIYEELKREVDGQGI